MAGDAGHDPRARPDGQIEPQKMEEITRREIEAGRMYPDDGLRPDTVRALSQMGLHLLR
jgi:hypothetical protein